MLDLTSGETGESSQEIFKTLMRASLHYVSRQFICALIVSATIVLASLSYGASRGNQVELAVAHQTLREVETIAGESTWFSILINNVSLTLVTFLPLMGAVWMIYVQFNTGWHLGAIAKVYNINYLVATSLVLTSIVGLIEYSAYTIALGESLFLVYSATQGEFQRRVIQHSWLSIIIVVSLLFLGGAVEAFLLGTL